MAIKILRQIFQTFVVIYTCNSKLTWNFK